MQENINKRIEEEFYVCPHRCSTGGYEGCCECGGWEEGEEERLCTEALKVD